MNSTEVNHVNDIPWYEAKIPFWLHFCKTQTTGWVSWFTKVDRCACGAIRRDGGRWFERNTRKKL
jgi:hypothetical protein